MQKPTAYSLKGARVIDIKGNSGIEEDIGDRKKGSSSSSKENRKASKTSKSSKKSSTSSKGSRLSRAHHLHRDEVLNPSGAANRASSSAGEGQTRVATGKNLKGNCFCQPCWFCCCNRICKVHTAVQFVAWSQTIINLVLMTGCLFVVMVWNTHYKHAEQRGFSRKNVKWTQVMEPNEDGFYILGFSYLMMWVVSFWVAMYHTNMSRIVPIGWCVAATYSTGLQVVALVHFPFMGSYINFGLWGTTAYGYWVMCHYDYLLRNRSRALKTRSEIELGILAQEGESSF